MLVGGTPLYRMSLELAPNIESYKPYCRFKGVITPDPAQHQAEAGGEQRGSTSKKSPDLLLRVPNGKISEEFWALLFT